MAANPSEGTLVVSLPPPANTKSSTSTQSVPQIVALTVEDAAAAAELHRSMIPSSFVSSLGSSFSRRLYRGILSSRHAFGYTGKNPDGNLVGFIACADSTGKVYQSSLLRCGISMVLSLLPHLWRISVIRRSWETLRYPSAVGDDLPAAEILCVAIAGEAQGLGLGKTLMQEALTEFRRRGATHVKVAVGADNTSANQFYQHCGFGLAVTRTHHGRPMNIYTIRL